MAKFDFNNVKNSPAVNAAEQEIVEGFDELNKPEPAEQPYTVLPKSAMEFINIRLQDLKQKEHFLTAMMPTFRAMPDLQIISS